MLGSLTITVAKIRYRRIFLRVALLLLSVGTLLLLSGCGLPGAANSLLNSSFVWSVAVSPDGHTVAGGYGSLTGDYVVRLWDISQPAQAITSSTVLTGHQAYVSGVTYSPDGHTLASADTNGVLLLWNVDDLTAQPTALTAGHGTGTVTISPDGHYLAAGGGSDDTVYVWDLHQLSAPPLLLKGEQDSGTSLSFSP